MGELEGIQAAMHSELTEPTALITDLLGSLRTLQPSRCSTTLKLNWINSGASCGFTLRRPQKNLLPERTRNSKPSTCNA